jgi:hypothetical protein
VFRPELGATEEAVRSQLNVRRRRHVRNYALRRVRPLETLIGVATGFFVGGIVGLAVVGEIDSTGSHPTRNAAVVLLLGGTGALLAVLAFVPRPARRYDRVARVPIADVLADPLVDPVAHLDPERVRTYALALNVAPPVVAFDTGDGLVLADGYHRVAAAQSRGATTVRAEIRLGTRDDARQFAAATAAREQRISIDQALAAIRLREDGGLDSAPGDEPLPYSADGYQS